MRGFAVLMLCACSSESAKRIDPRSVPAATADREDYSLCGIVAGAEAALLVRGAELGDYSDVFFPSVGQTFGTTAVHVSVERQLLGAGLGQDVTVLIHGGVKDGYSFAGSLHGVLGGARGTWFVDLADGMVVSNGAGLLTEVSPDSFAGEGPTSRDGGVSLATIEAAIAARQPNIYGSCLDGGP
jgi:hypothetical protein